METRYGKKRKAHETEEPVLEIQHSEEELPTYYRPSSSLLPARPLGAPLDDIVVEPPIKTEEDADDTETTDFVNNIDKLLEEFKHGPRPEETFSVPQSASKIFQDPMDIAEETTSVLQPTVQIKQEPVDDEDVFHTESVPVIGLSARAATPLIHTNGETPVSDVLNFDLLSIKCDPESLRITPRSRSSSTETLLADESLQRPSTVINDPSATLDDEPWDGRAPTPKPDYFSDQVDCEARRVFKICSKYFHLGTDIFKEEVDECVDWVNGTYTQTNVIDLFSEPDDRTELISTAALKKIIEQIRPSLPSQNDSSNENVVDGISLSSIMPSILSISTDETFCTNFRIKTELQEVSGSSLASSRIETAAKRNSSWDGEASTDIIAKKIKTERISPVDTAVSPRNDTAVYSSFLNTSPVPIIGHPTLEWPVDSTSINVGDTITKNISLANAENIEQNSRVGIVSSSNQPTLGGRNDTEVYSGIINTSPVPMIGQPTLESPINSISINVGDTIAKKICSDNGENIVQNSRVGIVSSSNQPTLGGPKTSTYLHLLPENVPSFELQNGTRMSHSSPALSTLISSGVPSTPGAINISPCDRINELPGPSSSNPAVRKKAKLTPAEYLSRKSLGTRDPRLQKSNNSSFPVGSASQLVQPVIPSLPNQTVTPVSSQGHSRVMRQESLTPQENLPTKHSLPGASSGLSAKLSKTAPQDPRKAKSYYQKIFGPRRGHKQGLPRIPNYENVGKTFFDREDLSYLMLEWNVDWLEQQRLSNVCPPICSNYQALKDQYESVAEYYNTYLPLHLLSTWLKILDLWKGPLKPQEYDCLLVSNHEEQKFFIYSCSIKAKSEDKWNWPKEDDFLICTSASVTRKLFGRVINVKDYRASGCDAYGPGTWRTVSLDIACVESMDIHPSKTVHVVKVTNIKLNLDQNDALARVNEALCPIILDPRRNGNLYQAVFVHPFKGSSSITKNLEIIKAPVLSPKHYVTLVITENESDSSSAISYGLPCLIRPNTVFLVCVKDPNAFVDLASRLSANRQISFALAVREEAASHLPRHLHPYTMKNRGPETIQVVLALISSMFLGALEKEFGKRNLICLIHEAQQFTETETALVLRSEYRLQHLVMLGRKQRKDDMYPILTRKGFDMTLFHRIWGKKCT